MLLAAPLDDVWILLSSSCFASGLNGSLRLTTDFCGPLKVLYKISEDSASKMEGFLGDGEAGVMRDRGMMTFALVPSYVFARVLGLFTAAEKAMFSLFSEGLAGGSWIFSG